ncbi:hypothetical protein ABPG74_004720 [Tetrahymena malaccensis]
MKPVRSSSQKSLANSINSNRASECIQVCIRLRPLLRPQEDEEAWDINKKTQQIYSLIDQKSSLVNNNEITENMSLKDRKRLIEAGNNSIFFTFDNMEGPEVRTQTIYNKMGKHIINSVLEGYHGSILCYGQTTSGKTFTMLGQPENPGILPCSIRDIFNLIQKQTNEEFNVWVSYMEIYNENINDLLAPQQQNLKIIEDSKWGTIVQGLKMQRVWNFEQAIVLMNYGEEHRKYRETSIHEHSSRSHTVFKIYLESFSKDLNSGYKKTRYSCLNLVDLAGSERLSEIDFNPNTLGETGYINKSLFILANCINKLAEGKKQHIPYRDSKLTRILTQALGGNSFTSIICCVSPAVCNFNQTLSTLRFATRAKIIQNKPIINEIGDEISDNQSVSFNDYKKLEENLGQQLKENETLSQQNVQLKNEISLLQNKMANMSFEMNELMNSITLERKKSEALEQDQKRQKITSGSDLLSQSNQEQANNHQDKLQNSLLKNINNEQTFLENAINLVIPMIKEALQLKSQDISHEMEYFFAESKKITQLYQKELFALQNKYSEGIKQIVKQICQEEKQFLPIKSFVETLSTFNSISQQNWDNKDFNQKKGFSAANEGLDKQQIQRNNQEENDEVLQSGRILIQQIEEKQLFRNIQYSFMDIINQIELKESLNEQQIQIVLFSLKNQYDQLQKQYDDEYEKYRNELEFYYRRKISMIKNQQISGYNSISLLQEITQDHENKLTILRHIYEQEKSHLEQAYIATIKQIEDCIHRNSYGNIPFNNQEVYKQSNGNLKETGYYRNYDENQTENSLQYDSSYASSINQSGMSKAGDNSLLRKDINSYKFLQTNKQQQALFKTPKFDQFIINQNNSMRSNEANKIQNELENQMTLQKPQYNGIVYIWGNGKDGRLGIEGEKPFKFPQIISNLQACQVSLGYHHSACISTQGQLLTWGRGNRGQLGHSSFENCILPTPVNFFIKMSIVSVSCGWQHTLALNNEGRAFSWGFGEDGQLGLGDYQSQNSPQFINSLEGYFVTQINAGHSHSSVITSEGILMMFGCNIDHRLMNKTNQNQFLPCITELEFLRQEYGSDYNAVKASLGVNHSAVITKNGNLYTSGLGNEGQLGSFISEDIPNSLMIQKNNNEMSEYSKFEEEQQENQDQFDRICYFNKVNFFNKKNKAIQVSCGDSFTLVINEQNQVYSFGKASYYRLGHLDIQTNQNVYEPKLIETLKNFKITSVSTGCRHAVAITNEGKVYTWGFNFYDQLGLGDSEKDYQQPTKVTKLSGLNVKQSSCGYFHTSVLVV